MGGIEITGRRDFEAAEQILTPEALEFTGDLCRRFEERRVALLQDRVERHAAIQAGVDPTFPPETQDVRDGDWQVAETPADLNCRWAEITGPVDRKMMINALNSGAKVFMADIEDALSPSWRNVIEGQLNLRDAVRRQLEFTHPVHGKEYRLKEEIATLLVRPRGWHLIEKNALVDGQPVSAGIFDFGLYFFHNGGGEELFIGSADLMPRNLDGRVEALCPILDPDLRNAALRDILALHLADTANCRRLQSDGTYTTVRPASGEEPLDSQRALLGDRLGWHLE